ncbi:tRNA (adenosine(37)-N6)-threonylcarbamoyltransferase complex dimerization subunit type 1 TsaB [Leucobacter insecticola]|uniref:tRNA (adenosine(37)-N6)-threonylcarbamoyltransferase complex dimerization subunit type 1 TsaB n=1 Tax=Leucobacter insecticola TaxID=2714934 RepID=UPI001FCC0424|nr:tRNA (adenosine(37)-N6)-threonylcarbamoyltransferase complex dimerization subunit type 1 TsaB [Leucobacter insecticola]
MNGSEIRSYPGDLPVELPAELRAGGSVGGIEVADGRIDGLLAIDTAMGSGVAFGAGSRIYWVASDDALGHAERIGGLIDRVLEQAGSAPDAVRGVVVGIGPGPFTGLRVGIAAAHAFALARRVPLLPLQGHEAVALAVLEQGAASAVRVVQDARRRELFATEYRGLDWAGVPVRDGEVQLVPRADYVAASHEVWPERIPAARLVELAGRRLAAGHSFEPDQALYMRAPDVKQPGAPKRVSG